MGDSLRKSVKKALKKNTKTSKITVEIKGKLKADAWEAFRQELTVLAKKYGVKAKGA